MNHCIKNYQDPFKYRKLGKYDYDEMLKFEYTGEVKKMINKLRGQFIEEYKQNKDAYLESDYERIVNSKNDWHCFKYLKYYKMKSDSAFQAMKQTLSWRKENKIDEIDDISNLPKELWLFGIFFMAGASKDGYPVVYCLSNRHRPSKNPIIRNLLKEYVSLLFESLDNAYPFDIQIDIVIDETNGSISNVDLDMIRWFVLIRDYWPSRINRLIIVGLPSLLQPVIRLVLSWLPKEWQDLFMIGNNQLLLSLIDKEQLPWYYGGSIDGSCRLAPVGTRWAREIESFQDAETMNNFKSALIDHIPIKEREELLELQTIYDRSLLNEQQ